MAFEGTRETKPVPQPTPDSRPYWDACNRGELALQLCQGCGKYQFYPRGTCSHCHGRALAWRTASGKASIWTYSVCYRPVSRAFADDVPYVVAIVELAEGPHMMTNIVNCDPAEVKVGMPVQVIFERTVGEGNNQFRLPTFQPAGR